ncbi:MAG: hypothetical protein H0U72_07030 [Nitrosospira sp.]|nr:hypothetical protein [Nitrosospira sp.]
MPEYFLLLHGPTGYTFFKMKWDWCQVTQLDALKVPKFVNSLMEKIENA